MTYRVTITPRAMDQLARLPKKVQGQIVRRVEALAEDPRPPGCRALKGADDLLRVRSGDYRIIYQVADRVLLVLVVSLGHRKDVYRSIPPAIDLGA